MNKKPLHLFKKFSSELDPEKLQRKFLLALLEIQNVERGSIWINQGDRYICVEAEGLQSEKVKGITISTAHPSIVGWVIENGKMTISDSGSDPRHYRELEAGLDVKSKIIVCFPLFLKNREVYGALQIIDTSPGKNRLNLDKRHLEHIQDLVNIGSISLSNAIVYNKQLKKARSLENALELIRNQDLMIGQSPSFHKCMKLIQSYGETDYPVMITGESGTGKELAAQKIHVLGNRGNRQLLVQNCSAIPEPLLESELFGYKKGAFSGASKDKEGLFQAADGGSVFLDEIGDMPLNLQARILRVIQNNEIKPLGATRSRKIDIRIISATNRDIDDMVFRRAFRQDLFFRLSVLPLYLPPLRQRKEDIPLLLDHFIKKEAPLINAAPKKITQKSLDLLMNYSWPGNVRELENLVRYLLVVTDGGDIEPFNLPPHISSRQSSPGQALTADTSRSGYLDKSEDKTWEETERAYALSLLQKNNWNISTAARDAGLKRSTFASRIKRLKIKRTP